MLFQRILVVILCVPYVIIYFDFKLTYLSVCSFQFCLFVDINIFLVKILSERINLPLRVVYLRFCK